MMADITRQAASVAQVWIDIEAAGCGMHDPIALGSSVEWDSGYAWSAKVSCTTAGAMPGIGRQWPPDTPVWYATVSVHGDVRASMVAQTQAQAMRWVAMTYGVLVMPDDGGIHPTLRDDWEPLDVDA